MGLVIMKKHMSNKDQLSYGSALISSQSGAILIWLIFMIVLISGLTGGLLKFFNTSTHTELIANFQHKAYYLAESGGRYATPLVKDYIDDPNEQVNIDNLKSLNNTIYALGTNGQFSFEIYKDPSDPSTFALIHSTGTVNSGSYFESKVKLTYSIPISFSCSGCNSDYEISKNGSAEWGSGTYEYEDVKMEKDSILNINGDVVLYVKEDFIAEKDTRIVIGSSSSLTIYVDNKAEFKKNFSVEFDPPPNRVEDFVICGTSNADTIKFDKNTTFIGKISAPYAEIEIGDDSNITGAIIGDEIKIGDDSIITGAIIGDEIEIGDNSSITYDSDVGAFPISCINKELVYF